MSADAAGDILDYLESEGIGQVGKLLVRDVTSAMRQSNGGHQYVIVKTVSGAGEPDPMDFTDIVRMEVSISMGLGDRGHTEGARMAMRVYKALALICNETINGTLYEGIYNVGSPYESVSGEFSQFSWPIEAVRYYGPYFKTERIKPYLYEAWCEEVDYDAAYNYLKQGSASTAGGCSSVRKGNLFGRNYDWFYSELAEFIVHTPAQMGRFATIAVASGLDGLTDASMQSEQLAVMPSILCDGMNDKGLAVSMHITPRDYPIPGGIVEPTERVTDEIFDLQAVRFIIDRFATVNEAENFIKKHVRIRVSPAMDYNQTYVHFIIADSVRTAVMEFIDGRAEFIDVSYMTNFNVYGVTPNADGTVYTPATQDADHDARRTNGITKLGNGLERWNKIAEAYSGLTAADAMRTLLRSLRYTKAYRGAPNHEEWLTEYTGEYETHPPLYVDSPASEFDWVEEEAGNLYASRTRADAKTWQTVHSAIYDLNKQTLEITVQEDEETITRRLKWRERKAT